MRRLHYMIGNPGYLNSPEELGYRENLPEGYYFHPEVPDVNWETQKQRNKLEIDMDKEYCGKKWFVGKKRSKRQIVKRL